MDDNLILAMALEMSATIKTVGKALKAARADIPTIAKDATNPHFGSKYASLSNIIQVTTEILDKHGIVVIGAPFSTDTQTGVKLMLLHAESSEWIACTLSLRPQRLDPQGAGSAITYARRYALSAMLNLDTDADDDGNAATGKPADNPAPARGRARSGNRPPVEQQEQPAPAAAYSDDDRRKDVRRLMAALRDYAKYEPADAAKLQQDESRHSVLAAQFNGKQSLNDLTKAEMNKLIATVLNRYKRAAEQAGE